MAACGDEAPQVARRRAGLVVDGPAVVVTCVANGDFLGGDAELLELLHLVLVVVGLSILYEVALLEVEVLHLTALAVGIGDGSCLRHVGVAHPLEQIGITIVVGLYCEIDLTTACGSSGLTFNVSLLVEFITNIHDFALGNAVSVDGNSSLCCHNCF